MKMLSLTAIAAIAVAALASQASASAMSPASDMLSAGAISSPVQIFSKHGADDRAGDDRGGKAGKGGKGGKGRGGADDGKGHA